MRRVVHIGLAVVTATLLVAVATTARAQLVTDVPEDLEDVGVTQKLNESLPLDVTFTDEEGTEVTLGRYFDEGRPVLLNLGYYRCPMLCNLVLGGMIESLREIEWSPGEHYEVVTVSIDPKETPKLALQKKKNYVESYGRPETAPGWHFLTGDQESIDELAEAVGFRYQYVEKTNEYAHAAVVFVITPDGRISQYLYGVQNEPRTVRMALLEAGDGRIGSVLDQFLMYCYRYDAEERRYTVVAWRIMRLGGVVTVLVFGGVLLTFWIRESRRQKRLA